LSGININSKFRFITSKHVLNGIASKTTFNVCFFWGNEKTKAGREYNEKGAIPSSL